MSALGTLEFIRDYLFSPSIGILVRFIVTRSRIERDPRSLSAMKMARREKFDRFSIDIPRRGCLRFLTRVLRLTDYSAGTLPVLYSERASSMTMLSPVGPEVSAVTG